MSSVRLLVTSFLTVVHQREAVNPVWRGSNLIINTFSRVTWRAKPLTPVRPERVIMKLRDPKDCPPEPRLTPADISPLWLNQGFSDIWVNKMAHELSEWSVSLELTNDGLIITSLRWLWGQRPSRLSVMSPDFLWEDMILLRHLFGLLPGSLFVGFPGPTPQEKVLGYSLNLF